MNFNREPGINHEQVSFGDKHEFNLSSFVERVDHSGNVNEAVLFFKSVSELYALSIEKSEESEVRFDEETRTFFTPHIDPNIVLDLMSLSSELLREMATIVSTEESS